MNFRKENIVSADDDTCGWVLENENYARWIQDDDGLLWIQGNAGAGKSTLMKYIYKGIQMPTVDAPDLKLSFFFHARGEVVLLKSPLGMFKSLLVQLYKGDPISRVEIKKEFDKNSQDSMIDNWEWTEKKLEELFSNVICRISASRKVTIFVDALDEAGEVAANNLAVYFVSLYEKVQQGHNTVKICFSSRHHPIVAVRVADNQKIIVENENDPGIRSLIKTEFKKKVQDRGLTNSGEADISKLKDDIAAKTKGLFQWVCLVLPIIFEAYREEKPLRSIRKILDELPEGLGNMYRYIIQGLINQKEQKTRVTKLFRWVCFAARPLSLEEMRHAMAVVDDLPPLRVYNLKDSDEYVEGRMKTRITALSGGLIEVREYYSGTVVQVNHQTVRDFLLEEGFGILTGLKTPSDTEKRKFEGSCHDILARSCVNYLWTEDVQQHSTTTNTKKSSSKRTRSWIQLPTLETLPLLQYAVAAYFWHASKAEQNGYHQETLLDQFDYKHTYRFPKRDIVEQGLFSLWRSAGKIFCQRDYLGVLPSDSSTLLHIASMANISTAVNSLIKKKVKVSEKDNIGQQAIHYAARGGATEVCGVLIEFSSSVINAKDSNSVTPLQIASRHYKADVMRLLITKGAKIKCFDEKNSTKLEKVRGNVEKTVSLLLEDAAKFNAQSLQSAAASGNLEAVRLLLAEGTDANAVSGTYGCALVAAAYNGRDATVLALLKNGANVNALSGKYGYALVAAALNGYDATAMGLLKNGAEVNAQGGLYGCALTAAAERGHEEMVYILLQAGAEVNAEGGKYAGALVAAAGMGHANIVKILLKRGANVNIQKGKYVSALTAAASTGHAKVVEILVEGGANINAQMGTYANALTAAVGSGHETVVKILLERGAKTDALSGGKINALARAARNNRVDIVQALLNAKAKCKPFLADVEFFNQDDIQRSLELVLLLASLVGRLDIVEGILAFNERNNRLESAFAGMNYWILKHGRLNANASTKTSQYDGYTALQLSAAGGHREIVTRLLTAGSNVDDVPSFPRGLSALQVAAKHGHLEIVKILLTAGASVDNAPVFYPPGLSALQIAAEHGHLEIVTTLLTAGANVDATISKKSETALQMAVGHGHLKIVELLLASRADPNATPLGDQGPTALQTAARLGNLGAVDMLLKAGADVNAPGSASGHGPALHEAAAAFYNHTDVVARLIAGGADVNLRDPDGYTAIYLAAEFGCTEVVELLRQAGAK
jgi:ankyrin repeat protein